MHGYCRLSRDEDKENYSSIEEQKRIIKDYASSRNWNIKDEDFYIDDNVSGYTFNRPEFTKMIEKVKEGKIDVVVVKDLSRIGRNNGRVLVLIDDFKNMQKNLIAVSEMGGSYDVLNDRDDMIGITTWFNERYVKECSKKTRDHMYSKQKSGRLIMGNYYGYEKVFKDDIPMLYIIEELKPAIETIFKLYVENGYGFQKISAILNTKYNYPTPSVYYRMKHLEKGRVVIFACGTGHPYFTTDTAAALRATEMNAEVILLGKSIDAVYSADPKLDPNATKFEEISYIDVLNKDLKVMDSTATAMCRDNHMPLLVFGIEDPENIVRAVKGEKIGTIVK